MKPRILLATTTLPDGSTLQLQEHDGRRYLQTHECQTAGPATRRAEQELARIGTSPFRSAKQPKIFIAGLGLGELLNAATLSLLQKKGTFIVGEPLTDLVEWQRKYFPESAAATDPRVRFVTDAGPAAFAGQAGEFHAILLHADICPLDANGGFIVGNRRWLGTAYDALQDGGLLGIAAGRRIHGIERILSRAGFNVAEHAVESDPNARKPRIQPIWLARKGKPAI